MKYVYSITILLFDEHMQLNECYIESLYTSYKKALKELEKMYVNANNNKFYNEYVSLNKRDRKYTYLTYNIKHDDINRYAIHEIRKERVY